MISCIYKIRNLANNKCYVGSAFNKNKRWAIHRSHLRRNMHHSILLQRVWNKYWEQSFRFEVIEYVDNKSKLIEREQYWIDLLKPEYNIAKAAGSPLGVVKSEETKAKLRDFVLGSSRDDLKRLDIWPHGSKCDCEPCDEKRKLWYRNYNKTRCRCNICKDKKAEYERNRVKRIKEQGIQVHG